jgi:hypothetical protein
VRLPKVIITVIVMGLTSDPANGIANSDRESR